MPISEISSYHIATSWPQTQSSGSKNVQSDFVVNSALFPNQQTAATHRKLRELPSEGRGHKFESCRARQSNQRLIDTVRKWAKAKLTINSPMKRLYWRVIGGDCVTAARRAMRIVKSQKAAQHATVHPQLHECPPDAAQSGSGKRQQWPDVVSDGQQSVAHRYDEPLARTSAGVPAPARHWF